MTFLGRKHSEEFKQKRREYRHTQEAKIKISVAHTGSKNPAWKGDTASLNSLHRYVKKRLPKPKLCEICRLKPPHDLANKNGNYIRDLSEWYWLCRRCHMLSDGRMQNLTSYETSYENRSELMKKGWATRRQKQSDEST